MRGYNPYAVKLSALALFIAPLLYEGDEVNPDRSNTQESTDNAQRLCRYMCLAGSCLAPRIRTTRIPSSVG